MSKLIRLRLIVTGRVQGVFFRHSARQEASRLGLSGWVRNLEDGSVELEAVGSREKLDLLVAWCHQGPPSAKVKDVQILLEEEHSGKNISEPDRSNTGFRIVESTVVQDLT